VHFFKQNYEKADTLFAACKNLRSKVQFFIIQFLHLTACIMTEEHRVLAVVISYICSSLNNIRKQMCDCMLVILNLFPCLVTAANVLFLVTWICHVVCNHAALCGNGCSCHHKTLRAMAVSSCRTLHWAWFAVLGTLL